MSTIPTRTNLLKGPAYASFNTATIHFSGDLSVDLISEWETQRSQSFGPVKKVLRNRYIEITGTPMMWDKLDVLFPYANAMPEDPVYGADDKPLVITPRNGAPLTIKSVAVTKMPGISLHPSKAILRDMAFTGVCAKGADPKLEASYFTRGAPATNVAQTGLDLTKLPNAFYSATFNGETINPKDGVEIDFNLTLEDDLYQGLVINKHVKEVEAVARMVPSYLTEEKYLDLLAWADVQPGDDSADFELVVSADRVGGPVIALNKVMVQQGGTRYGGVPRAGEVQFSSVRQIDAGALAALWTFSTVPDES